MKLKKLSETISTRGLKFLVYGAAGAGKTRLAATLPGNVLIVSAEAGLLSLQGHIEDERVSVAEVTTVEELRDIYRTLVTTAHGFDWVVLDSVSEIAEVLLASEKKNTKDPRQAYGELIEQMGAMLRVFRDLDVGVYFSAKAARVKEEETGRVSHEIAMPGSKLGQQMPYLFDEVFRLVVVNDPETKEPVRWLQTAADSKSEAKDRSGKLAPYEPADLGAIVAKIRGAG